LKIQGRNRHAVNISTKKLDIAISTAAGRLYFQTKDNAINKEGHTIKKTCGQKFI
jgi:hypothetical protein